MAKRRKKEPSLFDADGGAITDTRGIRWTRWPKRSRGGRAPRSGADPLPQLRALGHHLARASGRPRRAEAGPAPHPVHDVAAEPHRRRQASQVREGGRRRDGQLPSARRLRAVRDARPHGAAVLAALSADRRLRQLRLARWRQRGGDALHRVPARAAERRAADRDRSDDGAVPSELRRHANRAGGAAVADSEPPDQRRDRHRRRHGDQHSAAQPQRNLHGADQAARQRRSRAACSCAATSRGRISRPAARC